MRQITHVAQSVPSRNGSPRSCPQERAIPDRVLAIVRAVAAAHNLSAADILGHKLSRKFSDPRKLAMRACRRMEWRGGRPSYPLIGRWFDRDHTTILHACSGMDDEETQGESAAA